MGQKMGKSWKIIDVFSVASTPKNCAKSRHGQTTGGEEKFPFFFLPLGSANGGSLLAAGGQQMQKLLQNFDGDDGTICWGILTHTGSIVILPFLILP